MAASDAQAKPKIAYLFMRAIVAGSFGRRPVRLSSTAAPTPQVGRIDSAVGPTLRPPCGAAPPAPELAVGRPRIEDFDVRGIERVAGLRLQIRTHSRTIVDELYVLPSPPGAPTIAQKEFPGRWIRRFGNIRSPG